MYIARRVKRHPTLSNEQRVLDQLHGSFFVVVVVPCVVRALDFVASASAAGFKADLVRVLRLWLAVPSHEDVLPESLRECSSSNVHFENDRDICNE